MIIIIFDYGLVCWATLLFFMAFKIIMQKYNYYFIILGFFSLNIIINFVYGNGEITQTLVNNTINKINELEPFYIQYWIHS